jgi:Tol biopolymer transport system component
VIRAETVIRVAGAGLLAGVLAGSSCDGNVNDGDVVVAVTVLASLDNAAGQGDDNCRAAAVSGDGRYVAFESESTNLVTPRTTAGRTHVYVRDRLSRTTVLVSMTPSGGEGGGNSTAPSISADGRYVAFSSTASDLVPPGTDTNGAADVFVRDLLLGTTALVSLNSGGAASANGASTLPAISADGAYVAFQSTATDLVAASDANAANDVFRRHLGSGTTVLVSFNAGGTAAANGASENPSISADGSRVAFQSAATNLHGDDGDPTPDVFVRDLSGAPVTLLISRASGAAGVKGNGGSHDAAISGNGLAVAFHSHATNLEPRDTTSLPDIFVRDLSGANPLTELVTVHSSGAQGGQDCDLPAISFDGRFVVYQSGSASLVDGDTNAAQDVFLRDRVARTTTRASVATYGGQADAGQSLRPAISADGRFVAFESNSPDLVEVDVNGRTDILLRGPLY